ncbi:hypothetical protein NLC93_07425, partial [Candidatus Aminicenantes bacterium AC-335-G13]|nr:hypothetical protein [Candidatus Aminicenantes bacterium AC-335-G13]
FILICIDAPVLIRFQRIMKRGRKESVENLYEFIRKEQEEMTNKESAQQLLTCMKMADYTVINDGTIEELHGKLGKILENFKEE